MQGHVRQRKNRDGSLGSWQVIVYAGRDPITGKPRSKSASAPTKRAAMALRNKLIAEASAHTPVGSVARVSELFAAYMSSAGPASPNSRYNYELVWKRHLEPLIGALPAAELRGSHLNAAYTAMKEAGKAPGTRKKAHTVASAMCTWGMKNDWMVHNPARNATPPHVPKTPVRATPDADIEALLGALGADLFGLCVLMSAALGTRRGETIGIQWRDVDFKRNQVTVCRRVVVNPGAGLEVVDFTKTDGARAMAVDEGTMAALATRHVEARATVALVAGELAPEAFIFSDEIDGRRPWYPDSASRKMKVARQRLGLTDAHLHGLRHAVATRLISEGVDPRTVAERLGNSPEVVLKVYSHFVPAADRVAAEILGKALSSSSSGGEEPVPSWPGPS